MCAAIDNAGRNCDGPPTVGEWHAAGAIVSGGDRSNASAPLAELPSTAALATMTPAFVITCSPARSSRLAG